MSEFGIHAAFITYSGDSQLIFSHIGLGEYEAFPSLLNKSSEVILNRMGPWQEVCFGAENKVVMEFEKASR